MSDSDKVELLRWLQRQKANARADQAHYTKLGDLKMAMACSFKAVAFQEVIDYITQLP